MREEKQRFSWTPRTELGRKVAAGEVTSMKQVLRSGTRVLEPEIVDVLLPDLKEEVLEITSTQRMTACGRKMQLRAIVVVGNRNGAIAVGVGKGRESRDAVAEAIRDAKKHITIIRLGCGSWECGCGTEHSISQETRGKSGTTKIVIKPAPRGIGIVAGEVARIVLQLVGIKDAWSFAKGRTRNKLSMSQAAINALEKLSHLKKGKDGVEEEKEEVQAPSESQEESRKEEETSE
ncbi:30S ribosomal protein S5 [Candidatus Micrarchaeota archaeon CG1_02_51_15]|nr:MAG: 30S ribosomal protein S5 [Candidatus Micrarchaeota archaeon CG1_02_51_15]